MAWDTEGTRKKLQDAATAEFAERGPDGTTMARVAERAGVNKERLYKYFGDKRALFTTVLTAELEKLSGSVALAGPTLDDIGEFVAATFDYHAAHPELARLLQWEALAGGSPVDEVIRTEHYRRKVETIAAAQERKVLAAHLDPGHLLFLMIALAAWWQAVPQLAYMITGEDPDDPAERARRRESVIRAAQRLAT